jgi:hypothetical protein
MGDELARPTGEQRQHRGRLRLEPDGPMAAGHFVGVRIEVDVADSQASCHVRSYVRGRRSVPLTAACAACC